MHGLKALNRKPVHEAAARAYRKLAGEDPPENSLAALALVEWALQQPRPVHGLTEANAETLLAEVRDRMMHDSPKEQHKFLTSAEPDDPNGETIPAPFQLHRLTPQAIVRELVDVLHHKLAAMATGRYPMPM